MAPRPRPGARVSSEPVAPPSVSPPNAPAFPPLPLSAVVDVLPGAEVRGDPAVSVLDVAYEESGSPSGFPIVLLHGFPDDVRAWDEVARPLAAAGHRVLVPYLRGYGPTRFRDAYAPRMAEQAAIGQDLIDFTDALGDLCASGRRRRRSRSKRPGRA